MLDLLCLLLIASAGESSPSASAPQPEARAKLQQVSFERKIGNVEYAAVTFGSGPPAGLTQVPKVEGEGWFGTLMRRLPGDGPRDTDHYTPFVVEYVLGQATRAWFDLNFNRDLADDPPVKLAAYPANPGARSFLVDLRWSARTASREIPIEQKIRVVLEPVGSTGEPPRYRVQHVFAMVGTVTLEDKPHRAFLFDGNGDGLYTKDFFDGLFIDLDDDQHFEIDHMSPDFGPFAVPFQMGSRVYEILSIDPEGKELSMREVAEARATSPPRVGAPAPEFTLVDTAGDTRSLSDHRGRYVLVSFWASWCGNSAEQFPALRSLHDKYHARGLDILGVSYDSDRTAMEAFRKESGQVWPTSFSGRMFWEDPIGRLYQARWPGALYLIDPKGVLQGLYNDPEAVASRLAELMAPAE